MNDIFFSEKVSQYSPLTLMSAHNSLDFCHGTLAFFYLQLLILQWYIPYSHPNSFAVHFACYFDNDADNGTCCYYIAVAVAASLHDIVEHLDDYSDLFYNDYSNDYFVASLAFLVRVILSDVAHTVAVVVVVAIAFDDVSAIAVGMVYVVGNFEYFA